MKTALLSAHRDSCVLPSEKTNSYIYIYEACYVIRGPFGVVCYIGSFEDLKRVHVLNKSKQELPKRFK